MSDECKHGDVACEYCGEWFDFKAIQNLLAEAEAEKEQLRVLREAMREIYEVWAGSEGISETTAPEAYNAHLIYQMRDIAKEHLKDG